MAEQRTIVVPGELVGSASEVRPGQNTYQEGDDIFALRLGVKSVRGDRVNVISLSGRYEPYRGDMVIGTVAETGPSNWYINIGAANDVGMHVNDVPWRVEFGETSKYLAVGDSVLLKIVHVDEMKKAQVSMKDRQCRKLTGGLIYEVAPAKVPRVVGRQGSMIQLVKDYTSVRIFVGQNGVIWLDGEPDDVRLALEALHKIEAEAHTSGLTDRMKAWLQERRPAPVRAPREEGEGEPEDEQVFEEEPAPRAPRAPEPAAAEEEAKDEEEQDEEDKPRAERRGGERRAGPARGSRGSRGRGGGRGGERRTGGAGAGAAERRGRARRDDEEE